MTVRLKVAYAAGSNPGPESMIIKLPATAPAVKQVAIRQQFYQNEIHFYDDFARALVQRCDGLAVLVVGFVMYAVAAVGEAHDARL